MNVNLNEIRNHLVIFRREVETLRKEKGDLTHGKEDLHQLFLQAISRAESTWLQADNISQMNAKKNVLAVYGLIQLHKMLIEPKLSRNQSLFSYGRSFAVTSSGDAYHALLEKLQRRIECTLAGSILEILKSVTDPDMEAIRSALQTEENVQWPETLEELYQRCLFAGASHFTINVTDKLSQSSGKTAAKYALITVGTYTFSGLLGFFTGLITVPVVLINASIHSASGTINQTETNRMANNSGEWYKQLHQMLNDAETFKAYFARLFDEPNLNVRCNTDIPDEIKRLCLPLPFIEERLPSDKFPQFYCPISHEFLMDPIQLGHTEDTFERDQIVQALRAKPGINPKSNTVITNTTLKPNRDLRNTILQSLQDVKKQFNDEYKPKLKRCASF